jgi:iron complex outermembrane receptor protein
MRKFHLRASGSFVSLVVAAVTSSAVVAQQPPTPAQSGNAAASSATAAAANNNGGLQDIVVTARRRAESLQTAPVAVTALTAKSLVQQNIVSVADLATSQPSLGVRRSTNAPNAAIISIRGQVQSDPIPTSDPSVGVYIGDMYVARAYGVLSDLTDVSQVEILRGPQGSLFGRNTIGGAIRILPTQPDVSSGFTGYVSGGVGSFSDRKISGAITVPIIKDELAIRYAGSYRKRDGYTTAYIVDQPDLTPVGRVRQNDINTQSNRLSLAWHPGTKFKLDISGYTYRSHDHGSMLVNVNGDVGQFALNPQLGTFTNSPQRQQDFYSSLSPLVPFGKGNTKYIQGTAQYDLTDNITAKIAASYLKTSASGDQNIAGVVSPTFTLLQFAGLYDERQNQRSVEAQLLGKAFGGKLNWIAGAIYFNEKAFEADDDRTLVLGDASGSVNFHNRVDNTSKSAFVYGDYKITDRLSITLGGRYTWDTKALDGENRYAEQNGVQNVCAYVNPGNTDPTITTSTTANGPCSLIRSDKFHYFTYDAGLNYKVSKDTFVYIKSNDGVRSGGQQPRAINFATATAFTPDKAINYEAGIKTELFDRRLRINAAGFHVDYKNVQQQIILSPPVTPTTTTVIANLGKAKINGGEVELTARPTRNLTIGANAAYTKVDYDDPNTVQRYTPKWQYGGSITYDLPLTEEDTLRVHLDYERLTSYYVAQNRTEQFVPNNKLPGYGLLNTRISFLIGKHYDLSLWGSNLTNKKYYSAGLISGNLLPASVGEPRTYGVDFRYDF